MGVQRLDSVNALWRHLTSKTRFGQHPAPLYTTMGTASILGKTGVCARNLFNAFHTWIGVLLLTGEPFSNILQNGRWTEARPVTRTPTRALYLHI